MTSVYVLFAVFVIFAIIARGLRFYLLAGLLYAFGNNIKILIDKYFNLVVSLFFILIVGSIIFVKFI